MKCPLPCKDNQHIICNSCSIPKESDISELLHRIGHIGVSFTIRPSGVVVLDRGLPKEDLTFLRHNTSHHVDYEGNQHHVDQIAYMEVKSTK